MNTDFHRFNLKARKPEIWQVAILLLFCFQTLGLGQGGNVNVTNGVQHPVPVAVANAKLAVPLQVTTSGTGSNWVNLSDQPCTQVTVYNLTATTLSFRRNGGGISIEVPDGIAKIFEAITNANQISVQRTDVSNTTVTFKAEALTR